VTVRDLIAKLSNLPPDAPVGTAKDFVVVTEVVMEERDLIPKATRTVLARPDGCRDHRPGVRRVKAVILR